MCRGNASQIGKRRIHLARFELFFRIETPPWPKSASTCCTPASTLTGRRGCLLWSLPRALVSLCSCDTSGCLTSVLSGRYNPSMNYWCHVVAYAEQQVSGGLLVSFQTDTLRLYVAWLVLRHGFSHHNLCPHRYDVLESPSTATAVLEVLVALFFGYYFLVEFFQFRKYGKSYFMSLGALYVLRLGV